MKRLFTRHRNIQQQFCQMAKWGTGFWKSGEIWNDLVTIKRSLELVENQVKFYSIFQCMKKKIFFHTKSSQHFLFQHWICQRCLYNCHYRLAHPAVSRSICRLLQARTRQKVDWHFAIFLLSCTYKDHEPPKIILWTPGWKPLACSVPSRFVTTLTEENKDVRCVIHSWTSLCVCAIRSE